MCIYCSFGDMTSIPPLGVASSLYSGVISAFSLNMLFFRRKESGSSEKYEKW
ncbi:hypothetical protein M404DRAFT_998696 [Pisolithus tinctorius Marx 270]|uniref:Uncharacterized protein n=1 Tax=Pisolithus tinctorius Marx 270 TaxID=870435 RepID=A0A0C3KAB1_PISTI|nr:hypothetical protein M404DRAFT_998696 [Pisolithus tinctorius Marx 270]